MVSNRCFAGCKYYMKVIILRPIYYHSYLDDDDYGPLTYVKDRMVFYSNDYEELLGHQQTIRSFWETYQTIFANDKGDASARKVNDVRIDFKLGEIVFQKCYE